MAVTKRTIGIAAAGVGGVGVAVQSKINGALGNHLHDGVAAALISFGSGLVLITIITVATPSARRGVASLRAAVRTREIHLWQCLGGACGALLVASQGLTVTALGVAIFTVAVVAGQTSAGLAVDRAGLGPSGPQPFTGTRAAGAALTILAVLVAVSDRLGSPATLVLAVLPLIAGASSAWQQAVNGRVRHAAQSAMVATLVNFVVGTTALAISFGVDVAVRGAPSGRLPTAPWYYLGGTLGAIFIAVAAAVVRHTGVLLLGLGMVAGQLVGALAIDLIAPGTEGRPGFATWTGVMLTLIAVAIAAVRRRVEAPERAIRDDAVAR